MSILEAYNIATVEDAVEAFFRGRNSRHPLNDYEDADDNLEEMLEELIQRERAACQANADLADLRERLAWWIVMQHTYDDIEKMLQADEETRVRAGMDGDDSTDIYDAASDELININACSGDCVLHDPAIMLLVLEWLGDGGAA